MGRLKLSSHKPGRDCLLKNSVSQALLSIDRAGCVIGVQFPEEAELVLFIPESGDVLLCSCLQWHQMKIKTDPVSDLESTLHTLGVLIV